MNKPALKADIASVLLVDDDEGVRAAMGRALTQAGFAVTQAGSGDAAAALIGGAVPFDLLVTDVRMPGGLDGVALAANWRRRVPGRPVLFVSGHGDDGLGAGALEAHEAVLRKPFQRARLVGMAQQLLAKARRCAGGAEAPSAAWAGQGGTAPPVSAPPSRPPAWA